MILHHNSKVVPKTVKHAIFDIGIPAIVNENTNTNTESKVFRNTSIRLFVAVSFKPNTPDIAA